MPKQTHFITLPDFTSTSFVVQLGLAENFSVRIKNLGPETLYVGGDDMAGQPVAGYYERAWPLAAGETSPEIFVTGTGSGGSGAICVGIAGNFTGIIYAYTTL